MLLTLMSNLNMFGTKPKPPHNHGGGEDVVYQDDSGRVNRIRRKRLLEDDEEILEICKAFLVSYN